MLPDQRRGFWAAIARGLLALVGALVLPLNILSALLSFAFAWGIRRGQMWAAIAAAAFSIIPVAAVAARAEAPMGTLAIGIGVELLFTWFFVRAALALGRAGRGAAGRRGWTGVILASAAFYILFRLYSMPTASMEDTILANESVIVRNIWTAPRDGDMVLFHYPVDPHQTFIKRVVGVPGDRLRLVNKQLFRNCAPVTEPYVKHATTYLDPYRDNFPSEPTMRLPDQGRDMLTQNVQNGEVLVPPGKYFVLGDNRDESLDSRYWGFVSRDQIVGKPFLVYASYQLGSTPETVTRTILNTRWERLFKRL